MQRAPQVKLLVTSRERLNLVEEWAMEIGGLTFPEQDPVEMSAADESPGQAAAANGDIATDLESYSAIALFVQQARQVQVGFSLTEAERHRVLQICRLVEGAPLALELAAGWLRVLSTSDIVKEIERNLDFLATTRRNVPERHRSLRAIFEQSWQMLSEQEQAAFCKLSIFRGGCQREAAQQVAGASLIVLAGLVDKSLLRRTPADRYEVHELLRQYAAEKLWLGDGAGSITAETSSILAQTVWQQYSAYHLEWVHTREPLLRGHAPQQAVTEIRRELHNIRQAWHWAVTNIRLAELENSLDGLSRFYDITGLFQEGEAMFRTGVDHLRAYLSTVDTSSETINALMSRLLTEQARFLDRRGLTEQAGRLARQAIDLARAVQSVPIEAVARHQLGEILAHQGAYEAAQTELNAALELALTANLPIIEADVLRDLGIAALFQGNYAEGKAINEQALERYRALGDRRGEGIIMMNLGTVAYVQGHYSEMRAAYEPALQNFRETGDRWGESIILTNLSFISYEAGRYTEAEALCQEALAICRQTQGLVEKGHVLHNLGNLRRDQGDYATAQAYYEQALHLAHEIDERQIESYTLADLGLLHLHLGDYDKAEATSRQAQRLAEELGARPPLGLALTHVGHALVGLERYTEAEAIYQQALDLRRDLGEPGPALASQAGLLRVYMVQGSLEQAQPHLEAILDHLDTNPDLAGLEEPFRIGLTCYRALQAGQDSRTRPFLEKIHTLLHERAANISDPTLRRSFLENVSFHRDLVNAFGSI